MIAPWMAYCLAASALLSLAALALENGLRLRGLPLRWVWVGALLGSLSLAAAPWLRPAPAPATETGPREVPVARASSTAPEVPRAPAPRLGGDAPAPPPARGEIPAPSWERMHGPLLLLWALLSGGGILFLAGTHRALGRRRRTWRRVRVDGVRALLSKDTGPAVVGFLEGEIVLPDWVLTLSDPQRRLVLAHEKEHLRAGDSRLLAMALVALAVMPWNAPLWWQVRRLRDAIELDCDARVMLRHPDVRTYGALLVEIGQRVSRQGFAFAAFAESTSFLERRVRAMFERKPRGRWSLAGVSAALGMLLVLFACEVPLPTMADPGPARNAEASNGETRAGTAPSFPDTLVLHLQDGVWKLRVRAPEEEDVPEPAPAVCSDPADDDMGEVIWPNCGGFKLYADGSILPSRVYPVVGRMIVGGPAWKAGLRSGDALLTVDGIDARLVTSAFQILRDPSVQSWEDPFRVRIRRGAEEHELVFPVHPSW